MENHWFRYFIVSIYAQNHLVAEGSCKMANSESVNSQQLIERDNGRERESHDREFRDKEHEENVEELKQLKSRAKSAFTRARHQLLQLLEEEDPPSRRKVRDAQRTLNSKQETAMEILARLSDEYRHLSDINCRKKVSKEMEKMEGEFSEAQDRAQEYLDTRKDELSTTCSSISENVRQLQLKENEARRQVEKICKEVRQKEEEVARMKKEIETDFERRKGAWEDQIRAEQERLHAANREVQIRHEQLDREMNNELGLPSEDPVGEVENIESNWMPPKNSPARTSGVISSQYNPDGIEQRIEKSDPEFSPQAHGPQKASNQGQIGQDMWKQLQRVSIPIFRGDKRTYESWKAAFLACIDRAPATAEYKLLQLRQYLSGEALKSIENLGHSATAYEAAKSRLERKYGGARRQIALYLEELESFKPIRAGYAKDIEKFADLLDIAVINLKEAGRQDELRNGSLYVKLQKKIPESMLARYHRWIFEKRKDESVEVLREWIIQESEFQIIASETVRGLASAVKEESQKVARSGPRTFFGNSQTNENRGNSIASQRRSRKVCNRQHGVWSCDQFKKVSQPQRWEIAKRFKLCYRCLGEGHFGQACTRSRICGLDGCRETHNRLLHMSQNFEGNSEPKREESGTKSAITKREQNLSSTSEWRDKTPIGRPAHLPVSNATEGEQRQEPTAPKLSYATIMSSKVSGNTDNDFIALRTVPVVLKNGNRKLVVNAVLDDASTITYVNSDVAAELGLQGIPQKVTVNVLNGHVETFETMPVEVGLESINGKTDVVIHAFTTEKVTGNMSVIEWEKHAKKWDHLKSIDFPTIGPRPVADVLIGIDHADLHYSYRDIRGKPGEPIARLTPLGWTCVGAPSDYQRRNLHTNFARTNLVYDSKQNDDMDSMLRKFWEIESAGTQVHDQPMKPEEQPALQKVKNSLKLNGERYELAMPWKENRPELPNNYDMALRRLCGTEKRLLKNPEAGSAYSEIINTYEQKGYIRKVPTSEKDPKEKWYVPHFAVFRPDKATTKTRIVFDASAKCEGISLNDTIHQGPKLQRDLFNVLLRF